MKLLDTLLFCTALLCSGCAGKSPAATVATASGEDAAGKLTAAAFDADSAYHYVSRQVEFGPRVPNTEAHRAAGRWLASELERHGASVTVQDVTLTAFDGTELHASNIMGSYLPEAPVRILLLAHWDSRPWADRDPDEARRTKPVPGANDGASGVGVLLEIARQLGREAPSVGTDILFVDAEDWGTDNREDSWALGARHFAANMPAGMKTPRAGVLLDMVGGKNAVFRREQFSQYYAPELVSSLWSTAGALGYASFFSDDTGGAITDDHLEFIRAGIPVIDIIEFHPSTGFNPRWHTTADDMEGIDPSTLGAVGTTVLTWLRSQK